MYYEFEIGSRLPGLNEYINACRKNAYCGASMKKSTEELIGLYIMYARAAGVLPKSVIEKPLNVEIEWYEENRKRDVDNILSGKKFIFDALQKYGVIVDDDQKHIRQVLKERVIIEKKSRVIVRLSETE